MDNEECHARTKTRTIGGITDKDHHGGYHTGNIKLIILDRTISLSLLCSIIVSFRFKVMFCDHCCVYRVIASFCTIHSNWYYKFLSCCFIYLVIYCFMKSLKIPKGVIRIRISKKNRQHNSQKKKYKRTNNDLQNIHIKLKRSSNTNHTKNRGELRCSGRVISSCPTSGTRRVNVVTNPVISHE